MYFQSSKVFIYFIRNVRILRLKASGVCGKSFRSLWEELQESEGGASVVCGRSFRSLKEGLQ